MDEFVSVGRPLPRIDSAEPLDGRRARIVWRGGTAQIVDLSPALSSHRLFIPLRKDEALFKTMRVSPLGDALEWDDGAELSAEWIEELALASLDNAEFRNAMDVLNMSLDGMAARLGVARRLIAEYRKDRPIPPSVALATRYLVDQRRKAG